MIPLTGTAVLRSSFADALPVYFSVIDGRALTPAFVSPDWCAVASVVFSPAGWLLAIAPELMAPPRRGLWQPSQVRRSPGRTWAQLVCVWKATPLSLTTAS